MRGTRTLNSSQFAAGLSRLVRNLLERMASIFLNEMRRYCGASLLVAICALLLATQCGAQDLQPGSSFRDCPQCPEMVAIPSGTFRMGSSASDRERDLPFRPTDNIIIRLFVSLGLPDTRGFPDAEMPQHVVTIRYKFAMSKYPITVAEFATFSRETGYSPQGNCLILASGKPYIGSNTSWRQNGFEQVDDDPVVCMRVDDARAYIRWLNKKADYKQELSTPDSYRLPSEAEWEYAARARTTTAWWWGDLVGRGNANCDGCDQPQSPHQPTPVGTYHPNQFGLYDILGNTWQMVGDCWNPNYNDAPDDGSAWLKGDCSKTVERGGSFNKIPWFSRSTNRLWVRINTTDNSLGFRIARKIP
jgi:formylglycine-generating enzyme required for sulfatase activity